MKKNVKLENLEFYMIDNIASLDYLYEMLNMYETKKKMIEKFKEGGVKKTWKI